MQFIIRADEPFRGICQTVVNDAGVVAYSDGLTWAEYQAQSEFPVKLLSEEEFDALNDAYLQSRITKPREITSERYWDLLECLPPCRWQKVQGVEMFHVSERITQNLVTWCAKVGERHFEFEDMAHAPAESIAAKVGAVL